MVITFFYPICLTVLTQKNSTSVLLDIYNIHINLCVSVMSHCLNVVITH